MAISSGRQPELPSGEASYAAIRSDILTGRLAPAEKLRLEQLGGRYGVSVATLRETLSRLVSEKLVVAEGKRGFEVAPVSPGDLKEVAELRLLLETHALAKSLAAGDLEWEASVVAAHYKLAALEKLGSRKSESEIGRWKRYDWEFHQALISACGSAALMRSHAAAFDKYLRYQILALSDRGDIAIDEHRKLLDCALRRDVQMTTAILRAHVSGGVDHAIKAGHFSASER